MFFTGIIIIGASITGIIIIGALRTEKVAPNFRFVLMYNYRRVKNRKNSAKFLICFYVGAKIVARYSPPARLMR